MTQPAAKSNEAPPPRLVWGLGMVIGGVILYCVGLQLLLEDQSLAGNMISPGLWSNTAAWFGGEPKQNPLNGSLTATVSFFLLLLVVGGYSLLGWLGGAAWIARRTGEHYLDALSRWGVRGWGWLSLPFIWQLLWILPFGESWVRFLSASTPFWFALSCAGWAATFLSLSSAKVSGEETVKTSRVPMAVWIAMAIFIALFFTMNRQLYVGLQTPHGDSAMYEEHLWNVTHGKGFRSYLDYNTEREPPQYRLFLGEHIQVVHLLLLPIYLLWPSHLTLELCETVALASGALPLFWITRRATGSRNAASWLAVAYLFYFPLHFLDIEIDFKTFRPICFGVPALLFALDQWERGRLKTTLLLLTIALSAKEDYALVIAPLGLWIALCGNGGKVEISKKNRRWLGGGMALFAVIYLWVVIKFAIPYFRGGDVHYVRYFPEELGATPGELVWNVLTDPLTVADYLFTPRNLLFACYLLLPLGGISLLSPTRLVVALPLFGVLCLNQIAGDTQHHFHAPLIPIICWAAAAGLARLRSPFTPRWALCCAVATGLFFSLSPAGISFWDPNSAFQWRRWYVPGERSAKFAAVLEQIPPDARVASTDFVHPRFTHHARSYDYSDYRPKVPDDAEYIVIDTRHRYSAIKTPEQVKEYRDHPDQWELLPDRTDGYFIILKRR